MRGVPEKRGQWFYCTFTTTKKNPTQTKKPTHKKSTHKTPPNKQNPTKTKWTKKHNKKPNPKPNKKPPLCGAKVVITNRMSCSWESTFCLFLLEQDFSEPGEQLFAQYSVTVNNSWESCLEKQFLFSEPQLPTEGWKKIFAVFILSLKQKCIMSVLLYPSI